MKASRVPNANKPKLLYLKVFYFKSSDGVVGHRLLLQQRGLDVAIGLGVLLGPVTVTLPLKL